MSKLETRVTAVMITHNRRNEMLRSLDKLWSLPEEVPIILVDNGSSDGSAEAVARWLPKVKIIRSEVNIGAAARNLGVEQAATPYVALCDDDTWWAPGCLLRAADLLDAYSRVAVLSARLLNGPEEVEDPICQVMRDSPLRRDEPLPGKPLLGFLAGASVVRRDAFLEAGGFDPRLFIGGEEELLTLDLAVRGWMLCYIPELIVHHYPSPRRDAPRRRVDSAPRPKTGGGNTRSSAVTRARRRGVRPRRGRGRSSFPTPGPPGPPRRRPAVGRPQG